LLEIRMFGPIEVVGLGRTIRPRDFGGLKVKQVLEILLVERGRSVPKERLADLLWGERLPQNYLATVESYVSVLRSRLEPDRAPRESAVVTESGAYRLALDRVQLDLDAFDRLVADAEGEAPARAFALLQEALGLVRGDVLEDEPYADWVTSLRERYQRKMVQTLLGAAWLALDLGEHRQAVDLAEQAITADEWAEAAYRVQMLASYRMGSQEDAVRAFERCRKALDAGLGVEPMGETVMLHAAIQAHDDSLLPAQVSSPSASTVVASGSTLGRPLEVAQLEDHIRHALAGRFSLMLVEGDAGMGKSALLDDLENRLTGIRAVRWRCSEVESEFPFLAIAGALRALEGRAEAAELSPALADGRTLGAAGALALLDEFAAQLHRHAPFVLLIDRVDLADSSSVKALGHLQRRLAPTAIAVVATCRTPATVRPPVALLDWSARVRLERLTEADLVALNVPELHARTGGHPMFLTALMGDGAVNEDYCSPDIRERVLSWCRDAGEAATRTLTAASFLPQPFDPLELGRILDLDLISLGEELGRLCQHGLLCEQGAHFAFRDPPVRQILSEHLSPARRALLETRARWAQSAPLSPPASETHIDPVPRIAAVPRRRQAS